MLFKPQQHYHFFLGSFLPTVIFAGLAVQAEPAGTTPASSSISASGHKQLELPVDTAIKDPDLPNFHKVHSFLYRGGEPSEGGLGMLSRAGVKTIIDLRNPGEKKIPEAELAHKLGMEYIALPMSSEAPTGKQVKTFLDKVEAAKRAEQSGMSNSKIFLHCAHGSDRTGCLIGIWRVSQDGYSYEEAYKEMRKYYFTPKFTKLADSVRRQVNH